MIAMTLNEAAKATVASVIGNGNTIFTNVATDTRQLMADSLFIALKGDNFNGHEFIDTAISKGAVACMLDEASQTSLPTLKVDDTLKSMGLLAQSVRNKLSIPCIGITGSCGKTTIKEMIASILSVKGKVLATQGNFNNAIGVPLTLFRLTADDEFAVIEMGASKPGDIDEIAQLVRPNVAVISNIAEAHLEGLGNIQGVANVKGELLDHLQTDGTAILEYDSPWLEQWKNQLAAQGKSTTSISTFSNTNASADYFASDISEKADATEVQFTAITPLGSVDIQMPMPGSHNISNALAAIAAASAAGATLEECKKGLNTVATVKGRLQISKGKHNSRIIDDSYNANPSSLLVAMGYLNTFSGNKMLVLGDMAELGADAKTAHFTAGQQAKSLGIEALYAVGELATESVEGFGTGAQYFTTKTSLIEALNEQLDTQVSQWTILIKGSRSAAMEDIVKGLQKQEGSQ